MRQYPFGDSSRSNTSFSPTVAIMQWRNEIELHTDNLLKTLVWHGVSRESSVKELKKYDVVLTSYAVVESCFRKQHSGFKRKGKIVKEKSPLHAIEWNRVIVRISRAYIYCQSFLHADHHSDSSTRRTTSRKGRRTRPKLLSSFRPSIAGVCRVRHSRTVWENCTVWCAS